METSRHVTGHVLHVMILHPLNVSMCVFLPVKLLFRFIFFALYDFVRLSGLSWVFYTRGAVLHTAPGLEKKIK